MIRRDDTKYRTNTREMKCCKGKRKVIRRDDTIYRTNTREMKGCKEEEEGDKERKEESLSCGRLLCLGLLSHGIPILLLFNSFRISSFSN